MIKALGADLFKLGGSLHRHFYSKKIKHELSLPAPVISVGNMTLGGSGKTPFVIYVSQKLKKMGKRVIVLSRGYKGKATQKGGVVTDGNRILLSAYDAGDEPYLMAHRLEDTPIFVGKKRLCNALKAATVFKPDFFILDDGFQHFKMKSDMNILLINALDPFGGEELFPVGRLREPLQGMERAHVIVLTSASLIDSTSKDKIVEKIKKYNHKAPIYEVVTKLEGVLRQDRKEELTLEELRTKKVFLFCALGCPQKFKMEIEKNDVTVVGELFFKDHHAYTKSDIVRLIQLAVQKNADILLTTEKDIVKLKSFHEIIYYLKISTEIVQDENPFFSLLTKLRHCRCEEQSDVANLP